MAYERVYIEKLPSGQKNFVVRRSSSYNHHQRRPHADTHEHRNHGSRCAHVTRDEWNNAQDLERSLGATVEALTADTRALKASYAAADAEMRRLQAFVPALNMQAEHLARENAALRRSVDSAGDQEGSLRRLRHRNAQLENEKEMLRQRFERRTAEVRDGLMEQVRGLNADLTARARESRRYREAYEERRLRCEELVGALDQRNLAYDQLDGENRRLHDKIQVYERILRRHRLL